MADLGELNQLIWSMGLKFRAALAQRPHVAHDPPLLHQTFTLATTHLFLTLPDAIRRILKRTTPQEIAQRGKRLGSPVSPLTIWSLGYHYLVGREILIDFGQLAPQAQADEIAFVLDFWRQLAFAHRGDGRLDSSDAGATNDFLPPAIIQQLYESLIPVDSVIRPRLSQFLLAAQEYLDHLGAGARVGKADSGPYPLNVDRVLVVRDYYDLKGVHYPWQETVVDVPYRKCVVAMTFDAEDFLTLELSDDSDLRMVPPEYPKLVQELAFFAGQNAPDRVLPITEMDWLTRSLKKTQPKVDDWFRRRTPREQILARALPWIIPPFALLSVDEAQRACDLSPQALHLLPVYETSDVAAARWRTHRCLAPGSLSAFVPLM